MDSERTACWARHKRRVYAQAEGFENPQRADYRRLLTSLAKNSGLCQKSHFEHRQSARVRGGENHTEPQAQRNRAES